MVDYYGSARLWPWIILVAYRGSLHGPSGWMHVVHPIPLWPNTNKVAESQFAITTAVQRSLGSAYWKDVHMHDWLDVCHCNTVGWQGAGWLVVETFDWICGWWSC